MSAAVRPLLRSLVCAAVLLCVSTTGRAQTTEPRTQQPSTFAIGDIHGDYQTFFQLLRRAGIVDSEGRWKSGTSHLVQLGDVVDRGADSRQALELLMRLQKEAKRAGGSLVVLMGNHELWNVTGLLRYLSLGEIAAFAEEETAELRARKRDEILDLLASPSPHLKSSYLRALRVSINNRSFDREFPKGHFAHREAFSRRGRYGKWILQLPIAHRRQGVLFVHAGISPVYAKKTIAELNAAARAALREYLDAIEALEKAKAFHRDLDYDILAELMASERRAGGYAPELREHFVAIERFERGLLGADDGPLMYRGLAERPESQLRPLIAQILRTHDVEHIAVGHTQPRSLRIETRLKTAVILLDAGMNQRVYGGKPGLLAIFKNGGMAVWE